MKNLSKFFYLLFFFLITIILNAQNVFAQNCNQKDDPEFHSLRPYPGKPCSDSSKALFCSNDLIFTESFDVNKFPSCIDQAPDDSGDFVCTPSIGDGKIAPHSLIVYLDDSEFPILGNTETGNVRNSQSNDEKFDDAIKTNEYVSWYLNGVTYRAEYGETNNTDEILVNFSGPLKKLLPDFVQTIQRLITKNSIGKTNDNQIVVCLQNGKPSPCYKGNGSSSQGQLYRISDWSTLRLLDLFSYVPLSPTVDKKGEEIVKSIEYIPSSGTDIKDQKPTDASGTKPAPLYFAHTQETKDLIDLLNKTFTPMDCKTVSGNLKCTPLVGIELPDSTEQIECSTVNVRTNPGDNLFPNGPTQFKIPNVTYTITKIPCHVDVTKEYVCNTNKLPHQCPGDLGTCCWKILEKDVTCNAEVVITVKTDSTTPWADEIFSSAVADSGSTFRKMFPKVEPGAPVTCIADIPSVSSVTYDASKSQKPEGGTLKFDVRNPTTGAIGGPQLTFPHIGSIYEYFLKGIQTAIRPKGYGEPITSGDLCSNIPPPSEEINCDQSAPDIIIPGLFTKEQTHTLALNWVSQKQGNHVIECYNDTVRRAQSAGVNMGLTIALWLHESNASNYDLGYLQDFGAYWPGTFPGYVAQITEYFRRAKDLLYTKNGPICNSRSDVKDDFMAWALVYKSGKCDPTEKGAAQFYSEIKDTFKLVAPGCNIPTSTTDNTCP